MNEKQIRRRVVIVGSTSAEDFQGAGSDDFIEIVDDSVEEIEKLKEAYQANGTPCPVHYEEASALESPKTVL